jgi:RNA polymerase sigma-70 factor (ECF subfamily)
LAVHHLLNRYQDRLCQVISVRLDRRLASRVDPEDVLQEAMLLAALRLQRYLEQRPVGYYAWLKSLVIDQIIRVHRQHLHAAKRTVCRERMSDGRCRLPDSNPSNDEFGDHAPSPSQRAIAEEQCARIRFVLSQLGDEDRELLWMRHARKMSHRAISQQLKITEEAAKSRVRRAQQRVGRLLGLNSTPMRRFAMQMG